jgi:signal transduction histidine kinase
MCQFEIPMLLYYTHVPALLISLLIGAFIFISDRKNLSNRNLFIFILFLCFWIVADLLPWLSFDPAVNLFFVRIMSAVSVSLLFFFYFTLSFIGKDVKYSIKLLYFLPFLPIFALMLTDYNAYISDISTCTSSYGILIWYVSAVCVSYVALSVKNLIDYRHTAPNQIKIIIGALSFIVAWFLMVIILATVLSSEGLYMLTPLGIVIFIGILAYAITKYKMFNIKLIAAQVLTYAIWILIGSQFFFAVGMIMYLLISLTLLLSIIFGIFLIKSVQMDLQRKEELQQMADKLASANDSLRKLDNAKTEFISIASHQLRTPITAIKGFSSLILEGSYGEVSEGVHGALDKIYLSAERLVNLIEDLLNVSRIESGRMSFVFEKASMEKLLKELYDNFILVAKDKKFYLDLKVPETPLPEVSMDYTKIRELTSNFIDNALKYTERGGVTIKAELREVGVMVDEKGFVIDGQKSTFGPVVRVTVSDTGIGIPQEEIPYLFKKFSRGKDVSRLHVGGTGLGLYVGKAIAEAHNGQVWIESEGAGMGSKFIIEVPVEHVA